MITLAVVDFPEPLSPTIATVLPLGISIETLCKTFDEPYAASIFFIDNM